jgi:hypothetical protein
MGLDRLRLIIRDIDRLSDRVFGVAPSTANRSGLAESGPDLAHSRRRWLRNSIVFPSRKERDLTTSK